MRALVVLAAGQRPEVAELPTPAPGAGQVLLRVRAAALNPMDNVLASGGLAEAMEHRYPLVLGRDVAGVVEAVGDGVTEVSIGDEVIGHIGFAAPFQAGTLAEFATLAASAVTAKPPSLDYAAAAALPLAGGAALAALEAAGVRSGQTVLISGASGGVGRYAVQLAAQRGATVVATGTAASAGRLRELGADTVVDYTAGPVAEQVRAAYPDGVDVLVNLWANTVEDVPLAALRSGGTVSTITSAPDADTAASLGLLGGGITIASPDRDTIAALAQDAAVGKLQSDVSRVLPLDEAVEGLDDLSAGKSHGKVVITLT
ncbi:NADP-dependent oxidoreductase [Actinoplanes sp. M2I2]|uniref:NADP-dependent oxidoreductase n=1 Tax=Actinoplanes sp. M2I2 TaxID=1734444 RepID=UPI0020208E8A|nr:NADP-dependent oxidoreductase [Actinoplanes sp. M2I2]